jgi:hypothetical protein
LACFNTNPGPNYLQAVNYNLAYLLVMCYYALEYGGAMEGQRLFIAASDALYTNNVSIYYSTEGYMFQLFESTINYKCIK